MPITPAFTQPVQEAELLDNQQLTTEWPSRTEQVCSQHKLLTHRTESYINVSCFKPLNLGVFCWAEKADVYKTKGIHIFIQYYFFLVHLVHFGSFNQHEMGISIVLIMSEALWCMPPLKAVVIQLVSHSLVATNKESGATLPELQWTSVVYFG